MWDYSVVCIGSRNGWCNGHCKTCLELKCHSRCVNRLRQEISAAVAAPVAQAQQYVQQQPIVGVDETSFGQGNADGKNPQHCLGWLWVVVTPLVTFFQVVLSRSQFAAQTVLGNPFNGTVISDRHGGYNWLALSQRCCVLGTPQT